MMKRLILFTIAFVPLAASAVPAMALAPRFESAAFNRLNRSLQERTETSNSLQPTYVQELDKNAVSMPTDRNAVWIPATQNQEQTETLNALTSRLQSEQTETLNALTSRLQSEQTETLNSYLPGYNQEPTETLNLYLPGYNQEPMETLNSYLPGYNQEPMDDFTGQSNFEKNNDANYVAFELIR